MGIIDRIKNLYNPKTNSAIDDMVSRQGIELSQKKRIRKRFIYLIAAGVFAFIALFVISMMNKYNKVSAQHVSRENSAKVELHADNFAIWQAAKDDQIGSIEKNINKIEGNIATAVGGSMDKLRADINTSINTVITKVDETSSEQSKKIDSIKGELELKISSSQEEGTKYVDEKIKALDFKNIANAQPQVNKNGNDPVLFLPPPSSAKATAGNMNTYSSGDKSMQNKTTTIVTVEEIITVVEDATLTTLSMNKKEKEKEKEIEFDIPMGMGRATIVSGVNAPIFNFGKDGEGTKPVFLSLDSQIVLANQQVLDAKECLILGAAMGDLADSRAEIRLSKISCTFVDPKTKKTYKVEDKVEGWVFGEDGGLGPKGRLVTKEGKIIAAALPLALLETIMSYVSDKGKEGQTIYSATNPNAVGMAGYASQGASKGASNVVDKLSDIYIKYLESLNPIISIMPGREVTIAFKGTTTPLKLKEFNGLDIGYFEREGASSAGNIREDNYYNHSTISGVEIYE